MSDEKPNHEFVKVVGTVTELTEKKGGWYRIQIAVPGKQYPLKPETKLENLIAQAREIRDNGVVATFTIEEWDSDNINPNTSKPYRERRLSSVEEGTHVDAGSQGPTGSRGPTGASGNDGLSKEEWRRKDAASDKRALTAIAASSLQHTMPSTPTREDLNTFMENVAWLTINWQKTLEGIRDGDQDIPSSGAADSQVDENPQEPLTEHDDSIPFD